MSSITYSQTNGNGISRSNEAYQYNSMTSSTLLYNYNANIDLSLKITDLYQLSIKHYLNKNFNKSWGLISDIFSKGISNIDEDLLIKVYKLYLSLYDLLLKKEFQTESQDKLIAEFQDGLVYEGFVQHGIEDQELYLIIFLIEKSNSFDLVQLARQIQKHLDTLPEEEEKDKYQLKMIKLYLFEVLPYIDEADKAEKLVSRLFFKEDDNVKLDYLKKINEIKQNIAKREREEKERNARQEKAKVEQESHHNDTAAVTVLKQSSDGVVSPNVTETHTSTTRSSNASHLVESFKKLFRKYYRQNNNFIMVLLLLIGFILSVKKKRALVVNTLKMIFKISYV